MKIVIASGSTSEVCDCVLSKYRKIKILYAFTQSIPQNILRRIPSAPSSTLTLLLGSRSAAIIINAHDPMQNLSQTRIFYKLGQTRLILTPLTRNDLTWFQP